MAKLKKHLEDGISIWCGKRQWREPEPYTNPAEFLADPDRCKTCERAYQLWEKRQEK